MTFVNKVAWSAGRIVRRVMPAVLFVAVWTGGALRAAVPTLVARWEFSDYEATNETACLAAKYASADYAEADSAIRVFKGKKDAWGEVTDGTLGGVTATPDGAGRTALCLPGTAYFKCPLPEGLTKGGKWMVRLRYKAPVLGSDKRPLLQGHVANDGTPVVYIDGSHYVKDGCMSTTSGDGEPGTYADPAQWHTVVLNVAANAAMLRVDGSRSTLKCTDTGTWFDGDAILVGAENADHSRTLIVGSVEVWKDAPLYAKWGYQSNSKYDTQFAGLALADLRDCHLSMRGAGGWIGGYPPMPGFQHVVLTDGAGAVTEVRADFSSFKGAQHIVSSFKQSGEDCTCMSVCMAYGKDWPYLYMNGDGSMAPGLTTGKAGTTWNYGGYSPFDTAAAPFVMMQGSLAWRKVLGCGPFGSPVLSLCEPEMTLTVDAVPEVGTLTLDNGCPAGTAHLTLAYGAEEYKSSEGFVNLALARDVSLTLPVGVAISGKLTAEASAALTIDLGDAKPADRTIVFTAGSDIELNGAALGTSARGYVAEAVGNTIVVFKAPESTAYWTGAEDSDPTKPANWECYDAEGGRTELPEDYMTVVIRGETAITTTETSTFAAKAVEVGNLALTGDCDWSHFPAVPTIVAGATVDLRGRRLTLAAVAGDGTVTNSGEAAAADLVFDVAGGAESRNVTVAVAGNVRLVKEGAGAFHAEKADQSYTGGTLVRGGAFYATGHTYPNGGTVSVASNAVFTANGDGTSGLPAAPTYELAGGTFNSAADWNDSFAGVSTLRLTADSTMGGGGHGFGLVGLGYGETTVDLGGHTLDVPLASGKYFYLYNTTFATGGLFRVSSGGWLVFNKTGVRAGGTDFDLNCALEVWKPVAVRDLTVRWGGESKYAKGSGTVRVNGRFTPVTDYIHNFELQDGSVLDLSRRTTPCPTVNLNNADYKLTFAANATVTVALGGRRPKNMERIVTWSAKPNATFVLAADIPTGTLIAEDNGLYFRRSGAMILVR